MLVAHPLGKSVGKSDGIPTQKEQNDFQKPPKKTGASSTKPIERKSKMNVIELVSQIGIENVKIQSIGQSLIKASVKKGHTEITFGTEITPIEIIGDKPEKIGLILWMDGNRVREIKEKASSLECDYSGTPPFADAEWANDPEPLCLWCAGTGHPHGDERYGICKCPTL